MDTLNAIFLITSIVGAVLVVWSHTNEERNGLKAYNIHQLMTYFLSKLVFFEKQHHYN